MTTPATPYPIFLSIVIVVRDDQSLREMLTRIVETARPLVTDFEIVLVDNGSARGQREVYQTLTAADGLPNIQVYYLLRNVDAEIAYWEGIENSLGDYVLAFDPYNEDLSQLSDAIEQGMGGQDVVLIRNEQQEPVGAIQRMVGSSFRSLYRSVYGVDLLEDASQHRLISRKVVNFLLQLQRPAMHYSSLPATAGFSRSTIHYRAPRRIGNDHSFKTRARRALNLIFVNPLLPLRLISATALFGSTLNVAYSVYVLGIAFLKDHPAPGWITLSLQQAGMFFLFSVMLLVLTEYLIRMAQWNMDGASYFVVGEQTSATLTRTARLNVENSRLEDE